jgi:hypothetical protein
MHHGSILDVYFITHPNKVNITPNHCIVPDTALISHHYVADNDGILGQETILAELRGMSIQLSN